MIIYPFVFFLFAIAIIFYSRPLLYAVLRWKTERRLISFKMQLKDLHFSFEEMTYFISLPNRMPLLKNASEDDINTEADYTSFIFPEVKGLKIYVEKNKEEMLVSYMSMENFRFPYLDKLLYEEKINVRQYKEMSGSILLHPHTRNEFKKEVYRQISGSDLNVSESL